MDFGAFYFYTMKKIFIILLYSLICNYICSQQIYFNNRYDYKQGLEGALSVLEIDSGYIIAGGGYAAGIGSFFGIVIMQLDFNGDTVFKKFYGQPGYTYYSGVGGSLVKTTDGGYALGGSVNSSTYNNAILFKFNNNLDTLWTKMYNKSDWDIAYKCRQTNDGGFILTGSTRGVGNDNTDFYLVKTDSSGNLIWQKNYGASGFEISFSVEQTTDGGYILGGYTNSFGAGYYDTYIIKVDSLGNVQWSKTFGGIYGDNGATIIPTSDGGYILSAATGMYKIGNKTHKKCRVIKLFNNGSIEWDKTYGPIEYSIGNGLLYELSDGSFITGGGKRDSINGYPIGFLFKINSQGDSIWWREYELLSGNNSHNYLRDVKPTSDGGYIACGFVVPGSPDTGMQDMWVMKLDCNGYTDSAYQVIADLIVDSIVGNKAYFSNNSINACTTRWFFGDMDSSMLENPVHTYADTGTYDVMLIAEAAGKSDTIFIIVTILGNVSVADNINNSVFLNIYPNPANETVNINYKLPENSKQAVANIYNMMGKKVGSYDINNKYGTLRIDLSNLPNGLYFFNIIVNNNTIARKKLVIIK